MRRELRTGIGGTRVQKLVLIPLLALCISFGLSVPVYSQSNSPPAFPTATSVRSITENPAPFGAVGDPLIATDPDAGDTLTYSLSGKDAPFFHVVTGTGQLEARAPLDYEERSDYLVTVQATDQGGLYDTVSVNITVEDVDEAGEVFLAPRALNVGTEINAFLRDPDGSPSGVSWQWDLSPDKTTWTSIPGANSASYVAGPEDLSQFLRARAIYTDGHGPGKVAESLFHGDMLSPADNNPPVFPFSESGVRSVRGNARAGEQVGHPVIASDLDRDLLTYWLTGDASLLFDIGPYSGQLKSRTPLNNELDGRYFGEVHVFDGRGGSSSRIVRIDVGNVQTPVAVLSGPASSTEGETVPVSAPSAEGNAGPEGVAPAAGSEAVVPDSTGKVGALLPETIQGQSSPRVYAIEPANAPDNREDAQPAARTEPAAEDENEPVAALAAAESSPPSFLGEGTSANGVGPAGAGGGVLAGESDWLRTFLAWAFWLSLAAVVVAGLALLVLKLRRNGEREVALPPPTIGPERRVVPPPSLLTPPRDEVNVRAEVGAGDD